MFETHVAAHHDRALFDFAPLGLYMIGARYSVRCKTNRQPQACCGLRFVERMVIKKC